MGEAKVIQIANICKDMCNVPNPIPGRIYYAKGCAPALNTCGGGVEKTNVFMDKAKVTTPPQLRYALGRTNANGKGQGNHTLSFHANPYFGCVTATRFNNRETWIAEI